MGHEITEIISYPVVSGERLGYIEQFKKNTVILA